MQNQIDEAISNLRVQDCGLAMYDAILQTNDTVILAKKILLSARVQAFTASDVVALTKIILDRQAYLAGSVETIGDDF